jgi:hypothetical protein
MYDVVKALIYKGLCVVYMCDDMMVILGTNTIVSCVI